MKTGTSVTVDYSRIVLSDYNVAFFYNFLSLKTHKNSGFDKGFRILPESDAAGEYC